MDICTRIAETRTTGKVYCGLYHGKDIVPRKARFSTLGLADPTGWENELTKKDAEELLIHVLSHQLESGRKIMDQKAASSFASAFISTMPKHARFYSNQGVASNPEPLSHSFIDTGIFCEQDGVVGLLWICDEQEP